jgi:WD40 repeat protein
LSTGHNSGFTVYSLKPSFEKFLASPMNGGIGKARLLRSTNIIGLVGGGDEPFWAKDTVVIWNQHKKTIAVKIELHEPVKNLHVTNKKIVIVLESRVCIAALNNGEVKFMKETYTNENGICKYSYVNDSLVVATLGTKKGEVAVWKLNQDKHSSIQAHENNIVAIGLNADGSMVATASESGTNIHVYSTESGNMLYKLRRGTTAAEVYDISFSKNSTQLACTSNKGTVHVWDLPQSEDASSNKKSMLSSLSGYLPEYFDSSWSRDQVPVGDTSKAVCAFDEDDILHVATYEGNYFRITPKDGVYQAVKRVPLYIESS